MKLYITRHGQTQWNKEDRIQGSMDSPLTEEGIAAAWRLREELLPICLERIYSSDQGRARKTAEIIGKGRGIPMESTPLLRELPLGPWEGRFFEEVKKVEGEEFARYFSHPELHKLEGVEDFHGLIRRVEEFLELLIARNEDALIVTHGVTVRALLVVMEKIPLKDFWSVPLVATCSLNHVVYEEGSWRVLTRAKTHQGAQY